MVSPEHRFSHLFAQKTMSTSSVSDIYSGLVRPMELDLPPLCHRSSSTAETLAVRRPEPPRHPRDEEASGLSESSQDVGRARVERGREGEMRMVWANWALSAKKCGAFGFVELQFWGIFTVIYRRHLGYGVFVTGIGWKTNNGLRGTSSSNPTPLATSRCDGKIEAMKATVFAGSTQLSGRLCEFDVFSVEMRSLRPCSCRSRVH